MEKGIKQNINNLETIYMNKRHNKYKERITSTKFIKIIFKFTLIIIFFNSISLTVQKFLKIRKLENSSEITMTINGIGRKKILGENFDIAPFQIIINGIE